MNDLEAKKEYRKIMGLYTVDVGSRKALQRLIIPTFKKKTKGYSLKKKQLKAILFNL